MTAPADDLAGSKTPESRWQQVGLGQDLPERKAAELAPSGSRVVVLAPHPDDEVLGCGGAVAALARAGVVVHVVGVTDGENSHPSRAAELRHVRARERDEALRRLGIEDAHVHRLGLRDGGVADDDVVDAVRPLLTETDLVLAPWEHDGHPDHDAVGRAARRLPGHRLSYLVWAWVWAGPGDLPQEHAFHVRLGQAGMREKERAVAAFVSQVEGPEPILPRHVLDRMIRPDEVLLEGPA